MVTVMVNVMDDGDDDDISKRVDSTNQRQLAVYAPDNGTESMLVYNC